VLKRAFAHLEMTEEDILRLVLMLREETEADMDLMAAGSTFNATEAFYKVHRRTGKNALLKT
jgi:hypothetical protein